MPWKQRSCTGSKSLYYRLHCIVITINAAIKIRTRQSNCVWIDGTEGSPQEGKTTTRVRTWLVSGPDFDSVVRRLNVEKIFQLLTFRFEQIINKSLQSERWYSTQFCDSWTLTKPFYMRALASTAQILSHFTYFLYFLIFFVNGRSSFGRRMNFVCDEWMWLSAGKRGFATNSHLRHC